MPRISIRRKPKTGPLKCDPNAPSLGPVPTPKLDDKDVSSDSSLSEPEGFAAAFERHAGHKKPKEEIKQEQRDEPQPDPKHRQMFEREMPTLKPLFKPSEKRYKPPTQPRQM